MEQHKIQDYTVSGKKPQGENLDMTESIKLFWEQVGKKKSYWIPVLFFVIASYGYSVFSRTIGIDDMASDLYVGSGHEMISAGRWGMNVLTALAAIPRPSPASDRLLATAVLLLSGFMLSALFFHIHHLPGEKQFIPKYTVLSCFLITYPIVGEIWEYTGANYMSTGGMLISIVSCIYIETRGPVRIKDLLLVGALMTLPMSSYESGVLFYITLVCSVLFYKYCIRQDQMKRSLYWKSALQYVIPLIVALLLRLAIASLLRLSMGVAKGQTGETEITWGKGPISDVFRKLIIDTFLNYIVNGLVYLPITIFVIAEIFLIIFSIVLTIKNRNGMSLLGGLILCVSVFTLTFIQGRFMQYRTAIPLSALTSFAAFSFMELFEGKKKNAILIVNCLACYMLWVQSAYLNSELALNNQRSENEMRSMSILAQEILSTNPEKPVIFIGKHNSGEYFKHAKKEYSDTMAGVFYQKVIDAFKDRYGDYYYTFFHLTEFPDSNVNSSINYSVTVQGMMHDYLAYLGYDIEVIDREREPELLNKAYEIARATGMKPYEVQEADDFIIASLLFW